MPWCYKSAARRRRCIRLPLWPTPTLAGLKAKGYWWIANAQQYPPFFKPAGCRQRTKEPRKTCHSLALVNCRREAEAARSGVPQSSMLECLDRSTGLKRSSVSIDPSIPCVASSSSSASCSPASCCLREFYCRSACASTAQRRSRDPVAVHRRSGSRPHRKVAVAITPSLQMERRVKMLAHL